MDQQADVLERLLDEELRRAGQRQTLVRQETRYEVRPHGDDWAIVDCAQDQPAGRVVRVTRWRAIAQSVCIFGNELSQCEVEDCEQPAAVLVYGRAMCIDHVPPHEGAALIPLSVLRIWRASEYR
jgi:hypothetical protein